MSNGWKHLRIEAPNLLPSDTVSKVNEIAEVLVEALDIGIKAVELGKVATVGALDPTTALLQALADELNAIIRDLNQAGIYLAGDWKLEFDELQGGYQAFERRMVARLSDRTDPSRPNVSGNTPCLSVFLYASEEGQIEQIRQLLKTIAAFLQQKPAPMAEYPVPEVVQVLYGAQSASLFTFKNFTKSFASGATPPNAALVKWRITPSTRNAYHAPWPQPAPAGFFVTLSTFQEGIAVVYDRPRANDTKVMEGGVLVQPREHGKVVSVTGEPVVLFGGADMLAPLPGDLTYNNGIAEGGALKDGAIRVYGIAEGGQVIPLEQLKQGDTYFFQRTFYVPANKLRAWFTEDFVLRLAAEELPRNGRIEEKDGKLEITDDGPASTVYVRIAAVGQDAFDGKVQWIINPDTVARTGLPITAEDGPAPDSSFKAASMENVGVFSQPTQIQFPNVHTLEYLNTLKTALMVLVLSRPDLDPLDTLKTTMPQKTYEDIQANRQLFPYVALERCGLEPFLPLADSLFGGSAGSYRAAIEIGEEDSSQGFKAQLKERIEQYVHDLYTRTGPLPELEEFVVRNTKALRTFKWGDLLKSAFPGVAFDAQKADIPLWGLLEKQGKLEVVRNPYCAGMSPDFITKFLQGDRVLGREPQMQSVARFTEEPLWDTPMEVPPERAVDFLRSCPPSLKTVYEKFRTLEGGIRVPEKFRSTLAAAGRQGKVGSADRSPALLLYSNYFSRDKGHLVYCRGLFALAKEGQVLREAALALSIAGAATQRPDRLGEWVHLRPLRMYPVGEDLLMTVTNWVEALQSSSKDATENITTAIEALQARGVQLQQLIQRINALVASLTANTYRLPPCSALVMVSHGTNGIISDLVTSVGKPNDGPLAYGGGAALVVPLPVVGDPILAFLRTLFSLTATPGETLGVLPDTLGIGDSPVVPPEDPVPDVL